MAIRYRILFKRFFSRKFFIRIFFRDYSENIYQRFLIKTFGLFVCFFITDCCEFQDSRSHRDEYSFLRHSLTGSFGEILFFLSKHQTLFFIPNTNIFSFIYLNVVKLKSQTVIDPIPDNNSLIIKPIIITNNLQVFIN